MDSTVLADGEQVLLSPLLEWLHRQRRVRHDSLLVNEFRWFGRRVDLAVLTRSATATAFELKLRDNGRALIQAAMNALSFDRSYVVTATQPTDAILRRAEEVGVGVIIVKGDKVALLKEARTVARNELLRSRLLLQLRRHRGNN